MDSANFRKRGASALHEWAEPRRPAQAELGRGTLESDAKRDGPGHPALWELTVHLVLSRMATLPYSSMGMARSGALSLLKSPEAMENPPW
jgi:hypothetical protein